MGLGTQETSINSTNAGTTSNNHQNELAPLYSSSQDSKDLKIIIFFFITVTTVVTAVLFLQIQYGDYQVVPHGSVASDSERCSMIGADLMKSGGNAVDAAVATTFCISVVSPHLTGIGGGGLMLIYDHKQGQILDSIDFRVQKGINNAVGVPGFVAGLWMAHSQFGKLPWTQVIAPSIELAKDGFEVSRSLMDSKTHVLPNMTHNLALKSWLSGMIEQELITNLPLVNTLELVAQQGGQLFYNATLAPALAKWLPPRFVSSYTPRRGEGARTRFQGYDILVSGAGSGGPYLIDSLPHLNATTPSLVMALSMAFSENHIDAWPVVSGASISATDRNDLFVSVVSGLGSILGSQFLTSGGYLLNNAVENMELSTSLLDGWYVPTLSTPIIMTQAGAVCGRRFVFGAGDVRDGIQTLLSILKNTNSTPPSPLTEHSPPPTSNPDSESFLPRHFTSPEERLLSESIEAPRVRILGPHIAREQWHPYQLSSRELITLQNTFHLNLDIPAPLPYPSSNVIEKISDTIFAYSDSRGSGKPVTF
uniref:Gamma-glutamyltranspeptidase 2 n=1 Tax=Cacopsylla melanoneura TaxID=428564 RepID=A0A8D9AMY4_9HEMI